MRCTRCAVELIPGKRFCHSCGAPAGVVCGRCGATLAAEYRFCPECGAEVGAAAEPRPSVPAALAEKIRAAKGGLEGERKQVTVLFCDLAGSTAIAEGLDPEAYHELLEQYLALATGEIHRFEGVVNRVAGDGLMALFGAPIAHEEAPQRAVRAALAIRAALARLNERQLAGRGLELRARVGIHTGPVVVGTVGNDLKMDYTAIGDTTNLAARLESLARPGTVLMSEATHRLVRGFFVVRPTGPLAVKGKRDPVAAFEVARETAAVTPMTIAAERGLTPFVGRDVELAQLEACYARLESGQGLVVAVLGEAGMGKSRLLYEFRQRLAARSAAFFEGRCAPLSQAVPYSPFIGMFRTHFDSLPGAAKAHDGESGDAEPIDPLLCRLLAAPADRLRELPPDELKRESFDAVARLLLTESQRAPVVLILEDIQWIDDASRELLESLVARLAGARAMIVVSQRPEVDAAWRAQGAFTQLVLRRLADDEVTAIVRAVARGPLPEELERLLVAKAEGSPFFAEEITRTLLEEGWWVRDGGEARLVRPLEDVHIPGTVQEVIAARLDRLGPSAKRVLQVASVLGRQFGRRHLTALLEGEHIDVGHELEELERRGLLHRKHLLGTDEYRFGESLTLEVAYEGLLLKQRRQLHGRVGTLLEAAGGGGADHAAVLAHHWVRSDDGPRAVAALLRAAHEAEEVPSYRTAATFYAQAWELAEAEITRTGDDAGRRAALDATAGLARAAAIFGAFDLREAARAARRGRELAEALGDPEVLAGLLFFNGSIIMSGDREAFDEGLALAEQAVAVAERAGLRLTAMKLSRGLAINYAFDGRFDLARRAMSWVMDELAATDHPTRASDLYVSACWLRDNVLFLADDLDEAFTHASETYVLAQRGPNRTVLHGATGILAQIHFLRGEYAEALRWADESLEVAEAISNVAGLTAPAALALAARKALGVALCSERYLGLIEQGLMSGAVLQSNVRFVAEGLRAVGDHTRAERFGEWLRENPAGGRLRESFATLAAAEVMAGLGRLEEAERTIVRALALTESIGARSTRVAALCVAAEIAAASGDELGASRHRTRALALGRALGLGHYVARAERVRSGAAAAVGA